ncbi:HAD-IIA family hydrolase [Tropicibacter naphthalenivorans]|uniref:Putative hydrolase YutF n=1 Tax=Tropicibacter naphthalenivorans TaxID=441103 RepID=A0A0P1GFP5_9RHOB|nr:HAD hydrolase-like protein [Tropicibacter naphthalenivorans]CUH80612.1 putative hydrolase YutF [Tropicibacter naphthalenivorans]SMC89046.1 NagD protein [Tropicibacter naphthalenivorans]
MIKAAVFDIDGTLALMDKEKGTFAALPGVLDALAACRAKRIKIVAYTNGTFFAPKHYYPLLADAGIIIDPGHLLTPAAIAAQALAQRGYKRVMVLGGDGTTVPVAEAGIEVIPATKNAPKVDAVLLGYTRDLTTEGLEAVVQAVWDGATPFAGSVAPYFASSRGRMLGISGAIAAALENATDTKVTVFGKPETAGLTTVTAITGADPREMVVVGDDPKLEIRMGRRAGALTVGVTTGIADAALFNSFPEDERAHVVIPSLTQLQEQPWLK